MDALVTGIIEKVKNYLNENIKNAELDIYDVQFRRERTGWVLRIFIDGANVGLNECVAVSKKVSKWLDEVDIIPYEKYNLEVSTPGANREIRSLEEFKKYIGRYCKVRLKEGDESGRKNYKGIIKDVIESKIRIFVEEENKEFEIEYSHIKKANLDIKF
ncbi:ribosome maturation factor RimP [Deferribacter thermophilus]|uniref:ribosome maturation factor RimP n=1 Tax=Deferribacter thermophilus TaxID=53573 RepID=UPI003C1B551A